MPLKPVFHRAPTVASAFVQMPLGVIRPEGWLAAVAKAAISLANSTEALSLAAASAMAFDPGIAQRANLMAKKLLLQNEETAFADSESYIARMEALTGLYRLYSLNLQKEYMLCILKTLQYESLHFDEIDASVYAHGGTGRNALLALICYEVTGKSFLLKLLDKMRAAFPDDVTFLSTFALRSDLAKEISWADLQHRAKEEGPGSYYARMKDRLQGENLADAMMGAYAMARFSGSSKAETAALTGFDRLMRDHGVATGMFTAQRHLAGGDPNHGTSAEAIGACCEALCLIATLKGKGEDGDKAEKLAMNAVMGLCFEGKVQQMQQVNCLALCGKKEWYSVTCAAARGNAASAVNAYLTGLGTFITSCWYAMEDGVVLASLAPTSLTWRVNNQPVRLTVGGEYPYAGHATVIVNVKDELNIKLKVRIPAFADTVKIMKGEENVPFIMENGYAQVECTFNNGEMLTIAFDMQPRLTYWYHKSVAVEYGPMLFSVPACVDWNTALLTSEPMTASVENNVMTITAYGQTAPQWVMRDGEIKAPVIAPQVTGSKMELKLVPFALCDCGISQFPEKQ